MQLSLAGGWLCAVLSHCPSWVLICLEPMHTWDRRPIALVCWQLGHCFLVLPRHLVPHWEMAQPHLLGLPSLSSFQCQPHPSQLTAWSSAYKTLSLCCVPHHLRSITSPSLTSYQGMKLPAAQGAHHPSRPHTTPLPSPAFHQHLETNWNVSRYRPHLYCSHPSLH